MCKDYEFKYPSMHMVADVNGTIYCKMMVNSEKEDDEWSIWVDSHRVARGEYQRIAGFIVITKYHLLMPT